MKHNDGSIPLFSCLEENPCLHSRYYATNQSYETRFTYWMDYCGLHMANYSINNLHGTQLHHEKAGKVNEIVWLFNDLF